VRQGWLKDERNSKLRKYKPASPKTPKGMRVFGNATKEYHFQIGEIFIKSETNCHVPCCEMAVIILGSSYERRYHKPLPIQQGV
jgi:hypothetical protein